jgi:predicted dehydrogenase
MKFFLAPISEPLTLTYRINAGFLASDHWVNDSEQGGGRIRGEVCHFVDALMFLTGSPILEVDGRAVANAGRYSGDNVLASIRFANGSEGTITYVASGDRSFSKERVEVFGGGAVAVLEDFRRLELARNGRKQTIRSRWRQDKGHRAEWAAFATSIQQHRDGAIPFEEIVCSTLATLRIHESVATGKPLAVDATAFIDATLDPSRPNG